MMHCNGKCHLKKQLAEQSKKENSSPFQSLKEKFELQYFSTTGSIQLKGTDKEPESNFIYSFSTSGTSPNSIFHPPQA